MQRLQCTECGACVLVEKNSWEHTSVQWDDAARAVCPEIRADGGRDGRLGAPRKACQALTETIARAAVSGRIDIVNGDPVTTPVHPEGTS